MDEDLFHKIGKTEKDNLKKNYNRRGLVAELLAKFEYRLKYPSELLSRFDLRFEDIKRDFENIEDAKLFYEMKKQHLESFPKNHIDFLKIYGDSIDLVGYCYDENKKKSRLKIYEVKSRSIGIKRKPDITNYTYEAFKKAKKLGIQTYLVTVYFRDNWDYSFELKECDPSDFRINDGGHYRRCGTSQI